jgi:hypothetical protein
MNCLNTQPCSQHAPIGPAKGNHWRIGGIWQPMFLQMVNQNGIIGQRLFRAQKAQIGHILETFFPKRQTFAIIAVLGKNNGSTKFAAKIIN